MKIQVTNEDIATAKANQKKEDFSSTKECLVATAIKRQTGFKVSCGFQSVQIFKDENEWPTGCYILPKEVTEKINSFCQYEEIEPFEFELGPFESWE